MIATAVELKVFFTVIDKYPGEVIVTNVVLAFIRAQRWPRRGAEVVWIEDGEQELFARTIKRRLATIAGLYEYLSIRGDAAAEQNPVPRGLAMRLPPGSFRASGPSVANTPLSRGWWRRHGARPCRRDWVSGPEPV